MNDEELFKKNFPQYVTEGGTCLSPYWDLFSAGMEVGRDSAETDLASIAYLQEADSQKKKSAKRLTKAKELLNDFLLMAKVEHLEERYETVSEVEQFLNEVE